MDIKEYIYNKLLHSENYYIEFTCFDNYIRLLSGEPTIDNRIYLAEELEEIPLTKTGTFGFLPKEDGLPDVPLNTILSCRQHIGLPFLVKRRTDFTKILFKALAACKRSNLGTFFIGATLSENVKRRFYNIKIGETGALQKLMEENIWL